MTGRVALVASLVALGGGARAAPPLAPAIQAHFEGERDQGVPWLSLGAAGLVAGGALLWGGGDFASGLAIPLISFGVIEAAMGAWLLGASDARLAGLVREAEAAPEAVRARELARIRRTERALHLLRYIEVGLLVAGAGAAIGGALARRDAVAGLGLGLALESGILLVLDAFHARRARRYVAALAEEVAVGLAAREGGATVSLVGRF